MATEYRKTVLPSGLTVISEAMADRHSVAVGVWVRNGARDEPAERLGISHFIEHMMFKGTLKRDARQIAQSLESLGGHLDAFTGREQVCYYGRALSEHLPQVVDVLMDMMSAPRLDAADLDREKSVVREEIRAAEDNPEDQVGEQLAEQVWGDHALGRPILGRAETVDAFDIAGLRRTYESRYRADQLVVTGSGAVDHDRLCEQLDLHLRAPNGPELPRDVAPPAFHGTVRHQSREDLQQLYLSLGTRGFAYGDESRYTLAVLATLLGGGMSSRLFQSVREEAGLAYSVFAATDLHRESGMLSIHLGVAPERGREALARVREELDKLRADGPSEAEVESGRQQLRGSLVMGQESVSTRMSHLAQEELYRGRYLSLPEQVERILEVTREQVIEVAGRLLDPSRFALAALGPPSGSALTDADWPLAG